jgi:outer membrane protein
MKRIVLPALLALLVALPQARARELRLGIINSEQILSNYGEYQSSMRSLKEEKEDWDKQIKSREDEIQAEVNDFQLQENTLSPVTRSERRSNIDRRMAELEEFKGEIYGEPGGRFFKRNKELMEPLITKVNEAIRGVAEEEGYDLILDNSTPIVVYVKEESIDVNLNQKVLEKLQSATAAAPAAPKGDAKPAPKPIPPQSQTNGK